MKVFISIVFLMLFVSTGYCDIKYINPYIRTDGTSVSGHYRDTSNDGNPYNNANYQNMNGHRSSSREIYF
jgi:hypothetical protein